MIEANTFTAFRTPKRLTVSQLIFTHLNLLNSAGILDTFSPNTRPPYLEKIVSSLRWHGPPETDRLGDAGVCPLRLGKRAGRWKKTTCTLSICTTDQWRLSKFPKPILARRCWIMITDRSSADLQGWCRPAASHGVGYKHLVWGPAIKMYVCLKNSKNEIVLLRLSEIRFQTPKYTTIIIIGYKFPNIIPQILKCHLNLRTSSTPFGQARRDALPFSKSISTHDI